MKPFQAILAIAISQLSKIALGLVLLKTTAIYVGVSGMGMLGQLMSAITILTMICGGGITNGIIKYIAQYRKNTEGIEGFLSAAATYSLIVTTGIALFLLLFANRISFLLFRSENYAWVIYLLSASQVLIAFSALVGGVANGSQKTKVFSLMQVCGNTLAIIFSWWVIANYGFKGAIVAFSTAYSFQILPALYVFYKSEFWGKIRLSISENSTRFKMLFGYSVMTIVSSIVTPSSEMYLRHLIINEAGYSQAGLWQGLIKLSSVYIGFFGLFLAYYFMPILSAMQTNNEIRETTFKFLLWTGGLFAATAVPFYLLREVMVSAALSRDFLPVIDVMGYQLIGDFLKVLSFVIGFVFVARAAVKTYIALEIGQYVLWVILTYISFTSKPELGSIVSAYAATYLIYLAFTMTLLKFYIKKDIFFSPPKSAKAC